MTVSVDVNPLISEPRNSYNAEIRNLYAEILIMRKSEIYMQ